MVGEDAPVTISSEAQASVPEEGDGSFESFPSPDDEISELRRETESREQTIQDLQAAVEMERAKLEHDPYLRSAISPGWPMASLHVLKNLSRTPPVLLREVVAELMAIPLCNLVGTKETRAQ